MTMPDARPPAESRDALEACAREIAEEVDHMAGLPESDSFARVLAIMRRHRLRGPARCICTDGCDPACDIHGGVM